MPQMNNLLLKKDDGTDVTLKPQTDRWPTLVWRTNVTGTPVLGQSTLKLQSEEITSGVNKGKTRVNIQLAVPIMEIIPAGSVDASGHTAGAAVADVESVSMTFFLSPRGTNETRADLVRMFAHLMVGATAVTGQKVDPSTITADSYRDIAEASMLPYSLINLLYPGS